MKKTPLHATHIKQNARMGAFGGWDMPIQYAGILQEHLHTRTKASVFDICHMGEFELRGPTALSDLESLLTCNLQTLAVGQVRYGFMLNDRGGVIDDLTCYRLEDDAYLLVVNAGTASKDAAWIQDHISAETVFTDRSDALAKLDLQGPRSRTVLEEVTGTRLPELGYFRTTNLSLFGHDMIVSRTGYTGEWGYELYMPTAAATSVWDQLVAHHDCEPGGLGARDTLRLEMGYPLYGHELNEDQSPVATSRGLFIHTEKDFMGKAAVLADLEEPKQRLVGLLLDTKRAAREGDDVYAETLQGIFKVGKVTSGSVAPSLGVAVALAFVATEFSELDRELQIEIRGKKFATHVVSLPFYHEGTARG